MSGLISRDEVVNEIHKYFVEEIDKTPTEIDEDGDELYADMPTVNSLLACNKELSKRIKSLPSRLTEYKTFCGVPIEEAMKVMQEYNADRQDDNRLYIKIYADDEPSRKAEKLYQICGETENQEVTQWIKEYFPSVDRPKDEVYNYLKERIGDIVDDMKEFDAWFERMVWHVKECNRLAESADRPTGWIPVSERLPKEDGYYLVTWEDEDGRCTLCDYYRVQFGFGKCVKAWMQLPKPYDCGAKMGGDSDG